MANLAPPDMRGMAMAIYTSIFHIGIAFGATLMCIVADVTSFEIMFQISGIIILSGVFIFYLLTCRRSTVDKTVKPVL